jgi:hypothetical protein
MQLADDVFAIIGEGAALLAALDENSESFFDSLTRLREILAMLGESAPAAAPAAPALTFSLADKAGSAKSLAAYFDAGFDMPEIEQVYEAQTVADLARLADDEALRIKARNWDEISRSKYRANDDGTKQAAYEHLKARGISGKLDIPVMRSKVSDGEKILAESIAQNPEYLAVKAQIQKEYDERGTRLRELLHIADGRTGASEAEMQAAAAEYHALQKDGLVDRMNKLNTDTWNKVIADRAERHAALFRADGEQIVSTLLDSSSVSNESALAWAKSQVVDDDAKAKLKRQKYPLDKFYQDMADFYRLTGGKASAIRFMAGGKRANAGGIETVTGEKYINLDTSFTKETLWHELAHHLENDPLAKAAANGFLLKRRESDKAYSLRSLTGSKFYGPTEIAWKDSFTNPYVGRIYRDGATEVFSMGLQYLSDPAKAAWFAGKDPEMFDLVTGYVGNPLSPAMRAKLTMHSGVVDEKVGAQQAAANEYPTALAWFANRAELTADDWFDTLDRESELYDKLRRLFSYEAKGQTLTYVGAANPYRVFTGTMAKTGSKRLVKNGYLIVDITDDRRFYNLTHAQTHAGLETARAIVGLARLTSETPSKVIAHFFTDSRSQTAEQKVVSYWKALNE